MKLPSAASIHSDFSNPLKSLLDIESNNLIEQKDFGFKKVDEKYLFIFLTDVKRGSVEQMP